VKYCYKCGAEHPKDDAAFCIECGEKAPSKDAAAGGKGAKSASKSAPPAAEQMSSAPASAAPKPPNKRRAALWVAWVVVGLLAAGNIGQGLYFGVFKDGDSSSETAVVADVTTTSGVSTTTTVAPTTTTTSVMSLTEQAVSADEAGAKALVRNAMTVMESAYVDVRSYVPSVELEAALKDIEPGISFFARGGFGAASSPTSKAALDAVDYYGTVDSYELGTTAASGKTFGVLVDKSPGGGNTFYVNGERAEW
jgi:hypothetical protein